MTASALAASDWVIRFSRLVRPSGRVLDVAAGGGRHSAWFLRGNHSVVALDRDLGPLEWLADSRLEKIQADLELSEKWPLGDQTFDAVVVTNYLWRAIFDDIIGAVRPDGVLIYETFAEGNELHGRPRNPAFLLEMGELLGRVAPKLTVVAFEQGYSALPSARVVQRICAVGRARRSAECPLDPAPNRHD